MSHTNKWHNLQEHVIKYSLYDIYLLLIRKITHPYTLSHTHKIVISTLHLVLPTIILNAQVDEFDMTTTFFYAYSRWKLQRLGNDCNNSPHCSSNIQLRRVVGYCNGWKRSRQNTIVHPRQFASQQTECQFWIITSNWASSCYAEWESVFHWWIIYK